ncbi:MAG: TetR family transcriptional regulator [Sporichthyaceae bacterium]
MRLDQDTRAEVGGRLRAARLARGLTIRDVAGAAGVSIGTWSALENGKAPVDDTRLTVAARAVSLDVGELIGSRTSAPIGPGAWREFPPLELPAPLRGALLAFVELGYHGSTVRDIAARAGLSVPGVYHHWASKQQLLVALLDVTMEDLLRRTGQARAEADGPTPRLRNLVECLALFHTYRRDLAFIGASEMRSIEEPDRTRIAAMRTQVQRMVDEEVREGVRRGELRAERPAEAARAVVTLCTALPQWWTPTGPTTPEEVAAHYVDYALDLVRHDPSLD